MSRAAPPPIGKSGSAACATISTGSMQSHQPPGGGSVASTGAGMRRNAGSYILPQPSSSRTHVTTGIPAPMWLSTSSRPMGTGPNLMSPGLQRVASPPQPPPLPPPPPSPQLVPLKARLARSKSIASPSSVGSPLRTDQLTGVRRQDGLSVHARRAAFGHGPSKSLRESSSPPDPDRSKSPHKSQTLSTKPIDINETAVPLSTPSAFPPIAHPRERNAVIVCLASLVFLAVSALVAALFTTLVLPLWLLAALIRRAGLCWANRCSQTALCCRCNRPQRLPAAVTAAMFNPFQLFQTRRRQPHPPTVSNDERDPEASTHWCQCLIRDNAASGPQTTRSLTFRALSPAELRWLPTIPHTKPISDSSQISYMPLYCPDNPPLIVICLRFGAPGVRLAKLREVIATRLLLNRPSNPASPGSTPRGSCFSEKWANAAAVAAGGVGGEQRPRANSLNAPDDDTLARLTQCLTCLSTGYVWRECPAFRLEEHVLPMPAMCLPPEVDNHSRQKPFRSATSGLLLASSGSEPVPVRAEQVVSAVSRLPFMLHRPLWQVYLLEQYQDMDNNEPSDAESAAESDDLDSHRDVSWTEAPSGNGDQSVPSPAKRPRTLRSGASVAELKVPSCSSSASTSSFVCRRSGSAGVGSLLVFRLHAALSDDGKALVHLLTSRLADLPSRTSSPMCTPGTVANGSAVDDQATEQKRRWRGQPQTDKMPQPDLDKTKVNSSSASTSGVTSTGSPAKPTVPVRSYAAIKLAPSNSSERTSQACASGKTTTSCGNAPGCLTKPPSFVNVRSLTNRTTGNKPPVILTSRDQDGSDRRNGTRSANSSSSSTMLPSADEEEEDPEESEAAQWWYTFWSSSLATIATCCDLVRALLTGPAIILHKYFFTRADMGILTKTTGTTATASVGASTVTDGAANRRVYKSVLLSLVKLSRVRQVTKASYAEIILSLLAGGLRAYHQTVGLKHPPDLLSFLSVEVPVLPACSLGSLQHNASTQLGLQRCDGSPCPGISRLLPGSQRLRLQPNGSSSSSSSASSVVRRHAQADSLVETGLIGNEHRMVAIGTPPTTANTLCPGRHVLADICLPINTEGMLPRLWETRQRLIELNNSVDPLCLAWARTVMYTLMPHPMADWLEANFGGSAKASVSFTGIEVVSPFSGHSQAAKDHDPSLTYQMPPTRRLAYMSLLASKSAEARTLRRRLRRRLPRGALVCPPRLGTSFRALARHLTNANAGLVYIAGSPVIRIDTWMPSPRLSGDPTPIETSPPVETTTTRWVLCRDLSVAFTTYAGQLSLTFCANSAMDGHPNLDLIIQAMRMQLRKMCRLLAGRHVPTPTDRWLYRSSSLETRSASPSSALSLSPSLNPSLVLRQDVPTGSTRDDGNDEHTQSPAGSAAESVSPLPGKSFTHSVSASGIAAFSISGPVQGSPSKRAQPVSSSSYSTAHVGARPAHHASYEFTDPLLKTVRSAHALPQMANQISVQTYACQSGQPTEQLQDRLQWVQQQLNDAASSTPSSSGRKRLTDQELANLRGEFCALLRELKQRCSLGSLGISAELTAVETGSSSNTNGDDDEASARGDGCLTVIHSRSSGQSPSRLAEPNKPRGEAAGSNLSGNESTCAASTGTHKSVGGEFGVEAKRSPTTPVGGDFDEDPDFYIDAYGEDDEEFEEEEELDDVTAPSQFVITTSSAVSLSSAPPVHATSTDMVGLYSTPTAVFDTDRGATGTDPLVPHRSDIRNNAASLADSYPSTKQKRRRISAVAAAAAGGGVGRKPRRRRRRSSLLSSDVASFDLIPNRRGSLGGGTLTGTDSLLSKLVKPKLSNLIPGSSGNNQSNANKSKKRPNKVI